MDYTIAIAIIVTGLFGLYMAWSIGANDVANSMASAVGSGSISVKHAIIAASVCEFAGAVLVGAHVTDTVRKGIVPPEPLAGNPSVLALGMACALLSAAVWLHVATWRGMPVSTTHSIVGAVAGFGVVAAGWGAVDWSKMGKIVASWFVSPVAGGVAAFFIFKLIRRTILAKERPTPAAVQVVPFIAFFVVAVVTLATVYKGLTHLIAGDVTWLAGNRTFFVAGGAALLAALVSRVLIARYLRNSDALPLPEQLSMVERVFTPLVIISSCCVAFAHGANDVANAVGPLAAVVDIVCTGTVKMKVAVPLWVLALGGTGIVLGLVSFGYRVMHTVGHGITEMTPSRGVAANIAATTTVLVCTRLKMPISTTHTLVGAILGVGFARGLGAVDMRVARNIFGAWAVTVPSAAFLSVVFFLIGRTFLLG